MPQATPAARNPEGAVIPPSMTRVTRGSPLGHGHAPAGYVGRTAPGGGRERKDHRVLLAMQKQRAGVAVGGDFLWDPESRHDRESLADKKPRVVCKGRQRLE